MTRRFRGALTIASVGALLAGIVATQPAPDAQRASSGLDLAAAASSDRPTHVRISSFNALGASHTVKGGNKAKKYTNAQTRMAYAAQIIRNNGLEIVGFQEFQEPQRKAFLSHFGSSYGLWPGGKLGVVPVQNTIVWQNSKWEPIVEKTIPIPYFKGKPIKMPYVLLRNRSTGGRVWIYNSHNPANTAGPAQKYRDQAVAKEIALVKQLEKDYPGVPVIDTGDKNDTSKYVCPIMNGTNLRPAMPGVGKSGSKCVTSRGMVVDWITGSPQVTFTNYHQLNSALVHKTTDHRVVYADAVLPSSAAASSGIRYVVAINIEGLASSKVAKLPTLAKLVREGASTMNARSGVESVATVPNAYGMVTSRRIAQAKSGGQSAFAVVHDGGRRTGLFTSNPTLSKKFAASWSKKKGTVDRTGLDNGRAKINKSVRAPMDKTVVNKLVADLRSSPKALEFVDLSAANNVARQTGSGSARYTASLRALDSYLGKIVRTINGTKKLAGHTAIIVTSDHHGTVTRKLKPSAKGVYQVPFIVWGPHVRRGADLYALNPQFKNPGSSRPSYSGTQPIRNGYVANLATKLLGLPPVPGSNLDAGQTLSVF